MKLFRKVTLMLFLWVIFRPCPAVTAHPLVEWVKQKGGIHFLDLQGMAELRGETRQYTDSRGRVTQELQQALYEIECLLDPQAHEVRQEFQTLAAEIGAKIKSPLLMPKNQVPFWLLESEEFVQYQMDSIPLRADIVVIGAGLTGASAAYHLIDAAKAGRRIVVLEADRPGSQASGRNGGNFQLLPESYVDFYEGLVQERAKILRKKNVGLSEAVVQLEAEKQAQVLSRFCYHNFQRFNDIVERENIDCDYSPAGWLRIASSLQEEEAMTSELDWIQKIGPSVEPLSPEEIRARYHLPAHYSGRLIHRSGNYHPYKFLVQILKKAEQSGVSLHTGVQVHQVTQMENGKLAIRTSRHTIEANQVIVATNAFTESLFPELNAIQCYPSQIFDLEHATNPLQGMTVTEKGGDIYYQYPQCRTYVDTQGVTRGMLHFGYDFSEPVSHPNELKRTDVRSQILFQEMKRLTDERFPSTQGQPPSRLWVGPMAFTQDRTPIIGFMFNRKPPHLPIKNIILAVAFQGYGGSYSIQAGYVAAQLALTGEPHEDTPETLFSPARFIRSGL